MGLLAHLLQVAYTPFAYPLALGLLRLPYQAPGTTSRTALDYRPALRAMDGLIRQHVPKADMLPDLSIPSAVGAVEVAVDHPLARDERILLVLDKVVAGRAVD